MAPRATVWNRIHGEVSRGLCPSERVQGASVLSTSWRLPPQGPESPWSLQANPSKVYRQENSQGNDLPFLFLSALLFFLNLVMIWVHTPFPRSAFLVRKTFPRLAEIQHGGLDGTKPLAQYGHLTLIPSISCFRMLRAIAPPLSLLHSVTEIKS